MRVHWSTSFVAAATALLLVAGCSSDDTDGEATSTPSAPATSASTADTAPTETAPSDTSPLETEPAETEPAEIEPMVTEPADTVDDTSAASATRALFASVGPDDPGCTVAVGRDGEVVYAEAFGAASLDPTVPMTTDTLVDIGSTSKQFTATAILLLAERGELDLDDTLDTYVSNLPEWASQVTLRQMMHHESGIPDYISLLADEGFELTGSSTDADALAALAAATDLDFEPGTSWDYSNSNYFLLGQVVLAVTGTTLDRFLDDEVFTPLGLDMVMDPTLRSPRRATSYEGVGDAREVADSAWEQLGDGGIQTTPSELVRWAAQYWAPTIGDETIAAARLDGVDDAEDGGIYGAGISVSTLDDGTTVLSHSGGWGGFVTLFEVVPDQRLAVAATCTSPDTASELGIEDTDDVLTPWLEPSS